MQHRIDALDVPKRALPFPARRRPAHEADVMSTSLSFTE
jgi:hypothetical protein